MDWNFQSVKCLNELVEQYGDRISGVEKQNSMKEFKKNDHLCSNKGVLWISDWTAHLYLKVAGPTMKIQS